MVCSMRPNVLPLLGVLLSIECIISLKLVELRVPTHVPLSTRAALSCRWTLGSDVLYSVKWYKDGKEFFRHVPKDAERWRKFLLPGVDVETFDATGSNVTLAPVILQTSGRYRCEVSGEKPLFPTVSEHADMTVIVLPDHGPVLSGFRPRYRLGDQVVVNCTSGKSQPPTTLTWYINGEPAPLAAVSPAIHMVLPDGLKSTSVVLNFTANDRDFRDTGLKVKCLATLSPIYWRSNEETAQIEKTIHTRLAVRRYVGDIEVKRSVHGRGQLTANSLSTVLFCLIILLHINT